MKKLFIKKFNEILCLTLCTVMLASFLTGCGIFGGSTSSSASGESTADHLLIYEAYTSGGYDSGRNLAPYKNCYVVIYNPTERDISLDGCALKYIGARSQGVTGTAKLSGTINAKGFVTVEGGPCTEASEPPVGGDLSYKANYVEKSLRFERKAGKIALVTSEGADQNIITTQNTFVIDFLAYGSDEYAVIDVEVSPAQGISVNNIIRRKNANDTNNNFEDFTVVNIANYPDAIIKYVADTSYESAMQQWNKAITTPEPPRPKIVFDIPAGYYDKPVSLKLSSDTGIKIYYTLDGNSPLDPYGNLRDEAIEYKEPIQLKNRTGQDPVLMPLSVEYLNKETLEKTIPELWPAKNEGESDSAYKSRVDNAFKEALQINTVRVVAVDKDGLFSEVKTNSYMIFPNTPKSMFNMPVISINMDENDLFNEDTGIWSPINRELRGSSADRPASVEFFETDSKLAFSKDVDVKLHGGLTRTLPQKAFTVYKDKKPITNNIFAGGATDKDGKVIASFDNFVLRAAGNDWAYAAMRDVFWQKYCAQLKSFDTQAYRPCIAFLNGEFWGIYDIRERYDDKYFAAHYGISAKDVVVVESFFALAEGAPGDEYAAHDLKKFILESDLSDDYKFKRVEDEIDIDEYIDYMICEIYSGNTDWPHNNYTMWKNKNAENGMDTKWHFAMCDLDYGFSAGSGGPEFDHLKRAMGDKDVTPGDSGLILQGLMENKAFKQKFIDRFNYLLKNFFIEKDMLKMLNDLKAEVEPAYARQSARWFLNAGDRKNSYDYVEFFINSRNKAIKTAIETLKKS